MRFKAVLVDCTGVVLHEYVYGGVPPVGVVTVTLPLLPPKHPTFVTVDALTLVMTGGWVTVAEEVAVQPLESVTVMI
jgi:hypothetical protein